MEDRLNFTCNFLIHAFKKEEAFFILHIFSINAPIVPSIALSAIAVCQKSFQVQPRRKNDISVKHSFPFLHI